MSSCLLVNINPPFRQNGLKGYAVFIRIQDKAFNPDNVSHFVYSRGDGPQPQPTLAIFFVGGSELAFGADDAGLVWQRLIKGAELVTHQPAAA